MEIDWDGSLQRKVLFVVIFLFQTLFFVACTVQYMFVTKRYVVIYYIGFGL